MRWILLVWLATLVPCSVADLTTISDPNKFTAVASDDTLVVKRLLRSESNAATDNPTIAKDNQKLSNIVSEERSIAGEIAMKIFSAIEKIVGPKMANKLRAKFVNLNLKFLFIIGISPGELSALAKLQSNPKTRAEINLATEIYRRYYWKEIFKMTKPSDTKT